MLFKYLKVQKQVQNKTDLTREWIKKILRKTLILKELKKMITIL